MEEERYYVRRNLNATESSSFLFSLLSFHRKGRLPADPALNFSFVLDNIINLYSYLDIALAHISAGVRG
jgi:hypothetical protein